ncbi:sensor histidine kinase [Algoriphagus vanfongensis]|uniref:sensor histidine kinase n=1 Tax=Algoriphagus vanfongensis TaxID=426371 RepID=UPI000405D1E3|nr:HAMP domain-containing sensor histidine kinase [Algoriphagus vanfongensis]
MKNSYKQQIALRLTAVTALIILVVFGIIYAVVQVTVVSSIDRELQLETDKHKSQIFIVDGEIRFSHKDEWQEQEHTQLQLNPIFIEIVDLTGESMDRSPNLRENHLSFFPERAGSGEAWVHRSGSSEMRQMQIPLMNGSQKEGYLLVAKSYEDISVLLTNLRNVLLILYPGILISVFLVMRYHADRSIEPIRSIIKKANQITQNNLNERIPLIKPNDEIGQLSIAINKLLDRLESALKREKQFTSDASHELRTPLAVLRGTLEVLIRKPRSQEEYVQKIQTALQSIDKMTAITDQLLALARAELGKMTDLEECELNTFCQEYADEKAEQSGRRIIWESEFESPVFIQTNEKALRLILNNLTDNALKYSENNTPVLVKLCPGVLGMELKVVDQGVGISEENRERIFDPFFREKEENVEARPGTGLGLAIVKKVATEMDLQIKVTSQKNQGSTFAIIFPAALQS